MANLATTTYKICSDNMAAVHDLHEKLQQLDKKGYNIRLCELAELYGIDYEKERISVRGSVYFFELSDLDNVLTIDTETAWTACDELFNAINEKLDGQLSISYREIEVGCEVLCVHDEQDFFPEQVLVSCYGQVFEDGFEEPYDTASDAIDYWVEKMNFDRGQRSDKEMLEIIEEYEYPEGDDCYFYIYEFEFE